MKLMRFFSIGAAAAAAMSLAAPAFAVDEPAAAKYRYVGYMGGVKIGWAEAEIATAQERYSANLKMETGGLVGWFVEWRHASASVGAAGPALAPDRYGNAAFWKEKERYIEVGFQDGLAEIAEANPHPVEDENRPAVPADLRQGSVDPLTAIVAVGRTIDQTGSCKTEMGVFDGRRRYLLKVMDEGETEIGRSRYAPYGGDVRKCTFVFERVAGFKKKNSNEPTQGRAYFRRVNEDAPIMPVQIAAETKYGAAILHLRELTLLDKQLAGRPLPDLKDAIRE